MLVSIICGTLMSCQQGKKSDLQFDDDIKISSIIVLPVEISNGYSNNGKSAKDKGNLEQGVLALNNILREHFRSSSKITILTKSKKEALEADISATGRDAYARALGAKAGGDAVLVPTLHRFREREGGKYSSIKPASVSFEYKLLAVETGKTLCSGMYEETQQSVTENLFSINKAFKRGFKWVPAITIAKEGIEEKFASCRYLAK